MFGLRKKSTVLLAANRHPTIPDKCYYTYSSRCPELSNLVWRQLPRQLFAERDMVNVKPKPYYSIMRTVLRLVRQASQHEKGVQRIHQGMPVRSSSFGGPHVVVLNAAPGLGKTHALVSAAERMWTKLPVLHLGPTHDSFDNVDRKDGWGHW